MATLKGRDSLRRFVNALPQEVERKLLIPAGRAAGRIVADEAKARAGAEETRDDIVVRARAKDGRIVVKVSVKPGWGRTLGIWQEYGTDPHFISVADDARQGMTVRRINEQAKDGSLVIGSTFVGKSVFHPGAQAHPFMRTAIDVKQGEAVAAMQSFINTRVTPGGITGTPDRGDGQ